VTSSTYAATPTNITGFVAIDKDGRHWMNLDHIVLVEETPGPEIQTAVYCLGGRGVTLPEPLTDVLARIDRAKRR
jgi:hypothetical protein